MEENSSSQMGRFCSQWLLKIRICCHDSDYLSDSGRALNFGVFVAFAPIRAVIIFLLFFSTHVNTLQNIVVSGNKGVTYLRSRFTKSVHIDLLNCIDLGHLLVVTCAIPVHYCTYTHSKK